MYGERLFLQRNRSAILSGFEVKKTVFDTQTAYQRATLFETDYYGKVLCLDGIIQSSSLDERIYHEFIVSPAMYAHASPQKVLILGGGEGAVLREVLSDHRVRSVSMVDIDEELVSLLREHWPEISEGSFADSRVIYHAMNGRTWLEKCDEKYDIIVMDLTDPLQGTSSVGLYTVETMRLIAQALAPNGILSMQAESASFGREDGHITVLATVKSIFTWVKPYYVSIPVYGGLHGFAVAGMSQIPPLFQFASEISSTSFPQSEHVDGESLIGAFCVPRYIRERLNSVTVPLSTDERPYTITDNSGR